MLSDLPLDEVVKRLLEALRVSEFHFRDTVQELLEEIHEEKGFDDF